MPPWVNISGGRWLQQKELYEGFQVQKQNDFFHKRFESFFVGFVSKSKEKFLSRPIETFLAKNFFFTFWSFLVKVEKLMVGGEIEIPWPGFRFSEDAQKKFGKVLGHHVGNCLLDDGNLSVLYSQEATVTPTQDSLLSAEISPESEHNLSEMRKCFY